MATWEEIKKKKLEASIEERRQGYFCGESFYQLKDLPTWRDYKLIKEKAGGRMVPTFLPPEHPAWQQAGEKLEPDDESPSAASDGPDLSEKISLYEGDITKLELDSIVNAANSSLMGGGGVDGAIHRAAGKLLQEENRTHNGCKEGEAKISGGYNLPAKYIISTVGPRGEKSEILGNAYRNCLELMVQNDLRSIAFPCISTGVYGYPNGPAAKVALQTVRDFLLDNKNHEKVDRVVFCLFMKQDVMLYHGLASKYFPVKTEN